jgi:hypothetical protein
MHFLIAAVVLVGLLCAVDLLLTFAVLRRLREHAQRLGRLSASASAAGNGTPGIDRDKLLGRELPEFSDAPRRGTHIPPEDTAAASDRLQARPVQVRRRRRPQSTWPGEK